MNVNVNFGKNTNDFVLILPLAPAIRRDIKTVVFFLCVEGVGAICRRQPDSGASGPFFFFQFSRRRNRPRNRKSLETRRRDVLVA